MQKESSSSVRIFYPRFNKGEVLQKIRRDMENLKRELPLSLVILFGSYAKGNYTAASDIDLLVVYEGEERKEAYSIVKRAFDIPHLEPHVYAEREYEVVKETLKMMMREGIVIFQARDY